MRIEKLDGRVTLRIERRAVTDGMPVLSGTLDLFLRMRTP
jgi:hypothetical protein